MHIKPPAGRPTRHAHGRRLSILYRPVPPRRDMVGTSPLLPRCEALSETALPSRECLGPRRIVARRRVRANVRTLRLWAPPTGPPREALAGRTRELQATRAPARALGLGPGLAPARTRAPGDRTINNAGHPPKPPEGRLQGRGSPSLGARRGGGALQALEVVEALEALEALEVVCRCASAAAGARKGSRARAKARGRACRAAEVRRRQQVLLRRQEAASYGPRQRSHVPALERVLEDGPSNGPARPGPLKPVPRTVPRTVLPMALGTEPARDKATARRPLDAGL